MSEEQTPVGREIVYRVWIADDCEMDDAMLGDLFFGVPDMVTDWEVEEE